ncbi:hypothetical protein WJX73_003158 [Symbiochloris irregularis]|uniref:Tim44-like domain-containing protein n=1 Tax=Symbiochloris irregularis TaxID=706552 RepID=A0AAW1NWR7_9CHLO
MATKLARAGQRLYVLSSSSSSQQHQRQLSFFGEFFKKVKSEASSNEELQKAVQEFKKTGESVRERAKAASKVVGDAASASSEAARAAAQQAQRQAQEVSAAVRERMAQSAQQGLKAGAASRPEASAADPQPEASSSTDPVKGPAASTSQQRDPQPSASEASSSQTQFSTPDPDKAAGGVDAEQASTAGPHTQAEGEQTASTSSAFTDEQQQRQQQQKAESTSSKADSGPRQKVVAAGFLARLQNMASIVGQEVKAAVLPNDGIQSATRAVEVKPRDETEATGSALMAMPKSRVQQQWQDMRDKLAHHPIFQRIASLGNSKVFTKGREMVEDVRERWETSDSAMVQRIQDMTDNMFSETEMAAALREIRSRDPRFDMVLFLQRLKKDVPVVIKGSLEGDVPLLKQHCAPEMVERFSGIFAAQKAQGRFLDSTILDWSDVELVDLKFMEAQPVILVQFTVQQLNCMRDMHGNVVEGDPNSVQRVYYYWALQQDAAAFVGVDGKGYPPRWQLREQVVRAMHNLL